MNNIFVWRIGVWNQTSILAKEYPYKTSIKVKYNPNFTFERRYSSTEITVENIDTILIGKKLQDTGLNPLLLNFADNRFAGGSVQTGSGAQEESLFRRTNLCESLLQDEFYPIEKNEVIYTPCATVFRDTEEHNCELLEKPWQSAFISAPGIHNPIRVNNRLNAEDSKNLQNKIELILQTAYIYGHDSLILGALGCGAWRNPPMNVAEIFREVLNEWNGCFKKIVFACLEVGEKRRNGPTNYEVFNEVFSRK